MQNRAASTLHAVSTSRRRQDSLVSHGRAPEPCRRAVHGALDLDPEIPIILAVDRLDHIQRIQNRMLIAERVIELGIPVAFVQLLSAMGGARDVQHSQRVHAEVTRINERFGDGQAGPIFSFTRAFEPNQVYDFYGAADLFYVDAIRESAEAMPQAIDLAPDSSRAPELFLLTRFPEPGTDLQQPLVINTCDLDAAAQIIAMALKRFSPSASDQRSCQTFASNHRVLPGGCRFGQRRGGRTILS